MCAFLKLILLKLQERFFLYGELQLFLDFINFFTEFLMGSLDALDIVGDLYLVVVYAHQVLLVVVPFLSQFFPSRFGVFSDDIGAREFFPDALNLFLHLVILVLNISDHANTAILENTFLLELKPLLLECVHSFVHFQLAQEVADKIIDNDGFLTRLWIREGIASIANTCLFKRCLLSAD